MLEFDNFDLLILEVKLQRLLRNNTGLLLLRFINLLLLVTDVFNLRQGVLDSIELRVKFPVFLNLFFVLLRNILVLLTRM